MGKKDDFHVTKGNIFEDLGLENSDELLVKTKLMMEVSKLIKASNLTQKEIGERLGISQPKVSMLISGKISAFSNDTLMHYLSLLGCGVEIHLKKPRYRAKTNIKRGRIAVI